MKIKAKFKGVDGSLGYHNGENYLLHFLATDKTVQVRPVEYLKGVHTVIYDSLRGFLNNWQVL